MLRVKKPEHHYKNETLQPAILSEPLSIEYRTTFSKISSLSAKYLLTHSMIYSTRPLLSTQYNKNLIT